MQRVMIQMINNVQRYNLWNHRERTPVSITLFKKDIQLTPNMPNVSVLLNLLLKMWNLIQLMRYHIDLGLGIMLNGGGSVPPSSK